MNVKARCDVCLNRVDSCICGLTFKIVQISIRSSKDDLYYEGEQLGLKDNVLRRFAHVLYEVIFTLRFNIKTGDYTILKIEDGNTVIENKEGAK